MSGAKFTDEFKRDAVRRSMIGARSHAGPVDMARCHLQDPSMAKSTKSHLMRVLREAGVIRRNAPKGRGRTRSLRRGDLDSRFPGLLAAILSSSPLNDGSDFN